MYRHTVIYVPTLHLICTATFEDNDPQLPQRSYFKNTWTDPFRQTTYFSAELCLESTI